MKKLFFKNSKFLFFNRVQKHFKVFSSLLLSSLFVIASVTLWYGSGAIPQSHLSDKVCYLLPDSLD